MSARDLLDPLLSLPTTRKVGLALAGVCFFMFLIAPLRSLYDDLSAMNILPPIPEVSVPVSPRNVLPRNIMNNLALRQGVSVSVPQDKTTSSSSPAASSPSPQPQTTSSSSTTSPASSATPQPSTPTVTPTTEQSSSSTPTSTPSANTPTTTTSHSSETPVTSAFVTTDQGGQTITSIVVISDPASSSSTPTQSSGPASPPSSSSGGVSSSTIIGLSVAGGVALMGIIGFFIWKFTRKRGNEFNDNEEIKWPELNAHDANVPLPTHRTGGSGIDTADVRRNSLGYAPSTAANSTAELYPDPYAVPPLPHLDPNQPYHDDPNARFYDPYRGPIPQTFEGVVPGESIPMTQLAGRRSPGPGAAFDLGGGRASPAPPGIYVGGDFGGRASPAPQGAFGGGRASPGPGLAYAAGRASPAPHPASPAPGYGNYGPR